MGWTIRRNGTGCSSRRPLDRRQQDEAFAREHPVLFVVRRGAAAGAETVVGVLGISAMLSALFGSVLPRLDLPSINRAWPHYLDIGHWLGRLGLPWPRIAVPSWIEVILDHKQYWLPVGIALGIALGELERRRQRDAERDADPQDGAPAP